MNVARRVTVVVPLFNEEGNVPLLVEEVRSALETGFDWELVLVDDGSRDATATQAAAAQAADPRVRLVPLARNYGQSAALQAGFDHSSGDVVVSMDGDLQNDPADIPRLIAELDRGFDLVAGCREGRKDRLLTRRAPSWVANRIIRRLTGVPVRDNGCTLKAYRRELIERMHLYADMHRFIPVVAAATAGARIAELPVRHRSRRFGESKYGLSRVWQVMMDLLTVKMIGFFRERPLAMFATAAITAGLTGVAFAAASLLVVYGYLGPDRDPLIFPAVSLICLSLASYLLMAGLIAEVAVGEARRSDGGPLPVVRET